MEQMKFETNELQDMGIVKAIVRVNLSNEIIAEVAKRTDKKVQFEAKGLWLELDRFSVSSDVVSAVSAAIESAAIAKIRAIGIGQEEYNVNLTVEDMNFKAISEEYAKYRTEKEEEERKNTLIDAIESELEKHKNVVTRKGKLIDGSEIYYSTYLSEDELKETLEKARTLNDLEILRSAMNEKDKRIEELEDRERELSGEIESASEEREEEVIKRLIDEGKEVTVKTEAEKTYRIVSDEDDC